MTESQALISCVFMILLNDMEFCLRLSGGKWSIKHIVVYTIENNSQTETLYVLTREGRKDERRRGKLIETLMLIFHCSEVINHYQYSSRPEVVWLSNFTSNIFTTTPPISMKTTANEFPSLPHPPVSSSHSSC